MKKFLIKLSYTVFPLWLLAVGLVVYLSLYVVPNISGDISRLSLLPFGHEYDDNLQKRMLKETLYPTIEKSDTLRSLHVQVLNIGDSFSALGNGSHQNYLCHKGLSLINTERGLYTSPMQYAYNIMDKGIIDSTNVQVLIVQVAERDFQRYVESFDVNLIDMVEDDDTSDGSSSSQDDHRWSLAGKQEPNSWTLIRARDWVMYRTGRGNPIYTSQLDKDYFSSKEPDLLYFYSYDITNGVSIYPQNDEKVIQVFNTLCAKAQEKGLYLILMVAVDKYDLYQQHIVDNPYPAKTINEDIDRILGQSPHLLLTKHCLLPMVDKGELDVFRFSDTHWSYKASKVIADSIYQRISEYSSLDLKK